MIEIIKKHGFSYMADGIIAASRPCIVGFSSDEQVGLGESKVGGNPHALDGFEWPYFKELRLEFVAQINCAEMTCPDFPKKGILLFFYDNDGGRFSWDNKDFFRVFYYPCLDSLKEISAPQITRKRLWGLLGHYNLPKIYKEAKLDLKQNISLPDIDRNIFNLRDEDDHDYFLDLLIELEGEEERFIQIHGYPNPVQTDTMECEIVKITGRGHPDDWIMILEISYDKRTDMAWGDGGHLYYFCHIDDLRNCDFSRCWMIEQCS